MSAIPSVSALHRLRNRNQCRVANLVGDRATERLPVLVNCCCLCKASNSSLNDPARLVRLRARRWRNIAISLNGWQSMRAIACLQHLQCLLNTGGLDAVTGDEVQRVVAGLNARSQVEAFEAAKVVWNDTDVRLERALIKTLKRGFRPLIGRRRRTRWGQCCIGLRSSQHWNMLWTTSPRIRESEVRRQRLFTLITARSHTNCCSGT
jgi:hypothetical protein